MEMEDDGATRNTYYSDEVKLNLTTYSRSETTFGIMLDSTEYPFLSAIVDSAEAAAAMVDGNGDRINLNAAMRRALPTACFVLRHESPHSIETITSLLWEIAVSMSKEMQEYVGDINALSSTTTTTKWISQVLSTMRCVDIGGGSNPFSHENNRKKKQKMISSIRRAKKDVNHRVYLELACRFRIHSSEFSDVCESERMHRERCNIVQKGLIDLLSEVDPIKLLTKLKSAQVCRLCKTAKYIIPRQDSVRSADEGARTFLDCYNPIHGGEIITQNDG